MKNIIFVLIIFLFTMCKGPNVKYIEFERTVSSGAIEQTLNEFKATDRRYSLLFFKQAFKGDVIQIENCNEIIFKDSIFTHRGMGLAKIFRIDNTCTTKIIDMERNYSFKIKPKYSTNYKYIYIRRTHLDNDKYVIIYSNTLRRFL